MASKAPRSAAGWPRRSSIAEAARLEFGYRDEAKWVGRYGIVKRITKRDPDAYTDDGRHSKRRGYLPRTVEKPGVSPAVYVTWNLDRLAAAAATKEWACCSVGGTITRASGTRTQPTIPWDCRL